MKARLPANTKLRCIRAGSTLLAIGHDYRLKEYAFSGDDDLIELVELPGMLFSLKMRFKVIP